MSLTSLFKKKSKSEVRLFVDLGTFSVKSAVTRDPSELEHGSKILGIGEVVLEPFSYKGRYIDDLDQVLEAVAQSIDSAVTSAGEKPGMCILGISGGAIRYHSVKVKIDREHPDKQISSKELDAILEECESQTTVIARQKLDLDDNWEHLGIVVTQYSADGRKVANPIGLSPAVVECVVLHGFWEEHVQSDVDMVSDQLDLDVQVVWETAVASALLLMQEKESFLLVDIGGEAIEIVLVENGKVIVNTCCNIGANIISTKVANQMNVDPGQAIDIVHKFQAGTLEPRQFSHVKEIVTKEAEELAGYIASILKEEPVMTRGNVPICFTGAGIALSVLSSAVQGYQWDTIYSTPPTIEVLAQDHPAYALFYAYDVLSE